MSWFGFGKDKEEPATTYGGSSEVVRDKYANSGPDIAKSTSDEDGVQDMVGGVSLGSSSSNPAGSSGSGGGFNPYGDLGGIDVSDVAPMFGQQTGGVDYLEGYNRDGRDIFQRMVYNMGHSYLGTVYLRNVYDCCFVLDLSMEYLDPMKYCTCSTLTYMMQLVQLVHGFLSSLFFFLSLSLSLSWTNNRWHCSGWCIRRECFGIIFFFFDSQTKKFDPTLIQANLTCTFFSFFSSWTL